jgi:hypothetical protein
MHTVKNPMSSMISTMNKVAIMTGMTISWNIKSTMDPAYHLFSWLSNSQDSIMRHISLLKVRAR